MSLIKFKHKVVLMKYNFSRTIICDATICLNLIVKLNILQLINTSRKRKPFSSLLKIQKQQKML